MKQLNNFETGEVISIIKNSETGILYHKFESPKTRGLKLPILERVIPAIDKNTEIDLSQLEHPVLFCDVQNYLALLEVLKYEPAFGISDDVKNWKFSDSPIRLIVNKKILTNDMLLNNAIAGLVQYALNEVSIKSRIVDTSTAMFLYIYLKYLNPEHKEIIDNSDTIEIENLN